MIPITHNDLVHLTKIGNYQQTLYVIAQNNGNNEKKDNINTWILWFCLLISRSEKVSTRWS